MLKDLDESNVVEAANFFILTDDINNFLLKRNESESNIYPINNEKFLTC